MVERDVVTSSGAYTYGLAQVVKDLLRAFFFFFVIGGLNHLHPKAGDYTVVVSAFEPKYSGPFRITVESQIPFELKRILQEGAGMYMNGVRGQKGRYQLVLPCSGQIKYVKSVSFSRKPWMTA